VQGGGVTSLLRSSLANAGMRAIVSSQQPPNGPVHPCRPSTSSSRLSPQSLHHGHCAQVLKHVCAKRDLAASDMAAATTSSRAWDCDPSPVLLARRGIVERDPSLFLVLAVLSSQAQVQPRPRHCWAPNHSAVPEKQRLPTWFCAPCRAPCVSHSGTPAALPRVYRRNVTVVTALEVSNRLAESPFTTANRSAAQAKTR